MIKRENLQTGAKYGNSYGDTNFIGTRVENKQNVSTYKIDVPFTRALTGERFVVAITFKTSVPVDTLPAEWLPALTRAKAYVDQELSTIGSVTSFASGAIEWTTEDITPA